MGKAGLPASGLGANGSSGSHSRQPPRETLVKQRHLWMERRQLPRQRQTCRQRRPRQRPPAAPGPRRAAERRPAAAPPRARADGAGPGLARFLRRPPSPRRPPAARRGSRRIPAPRRPRRHRGKGALLCRAPGRGVKHLPEEHRGCGGARTELPRRARRGTVTNQPQTTASPRTYPSENLLSKDRGLEICTEQKQWRIFF